MFLGCYELWMLRVWMLRILDATALDALIVSLLRHVCLLFPDGKNKLASGYYHVGVLRFFCFSGRNLGRNLGIRLYKSYISEVSYHI